MIFCTRQHPQITTVKHHTPSKKLDILSYVVKHVQSKGLIVM